MILVVPFNGSSSDYFTELSSRILKFGGLGGHRLLVVSGPEHLAEAEAFAAAVRSQLVSSTVVSTRQNDSSQVLLFREGVITAATTKTGPQEIPSHPVLWIENGYLPTAPDWSDKLQSAFFNSGGGQRILAEWERMPDMVVGGSASRVTVPGGWAPVGPAVFPAQFILSCEAISMINNLTDPWRKWLQFAMGDRRTESPLLSSGAESLLSKDQEEPAKPRRMAASRPVAQPEPTPTPT